MTCGRKIKLEHEHKEGFQTDNRLYVSDMNSDTGFVWTSDTDMANIGHLWSTIRIQFKKLNPKRNIFTN